MKYAFKMFLMYTLPISSRSVQYRYQQCGIDNSYSIARKTDFKEKKKKRGITEDTVLVLLC